jgi:uncharacterized protein
MPVTPTYPGVYIEEVASGVRTITPVATAITAFIGSAPRGLANDPVRVQGFAEYQRKFGGLAVSSPMSFAVYHFFQNGGSDALIVRVVHSDAQPATMSVGGLPLEVASAGTWGNNVRVRIDHDTRDKTDVNPKLFNLYLYDSDSRTEEQFRNLSFEPDHPRYVKHILEEQSDLARIANGQTVSGRPGASGEIKSGTLWFEDDNDGSGFTKAQNGADGSLIDEADLLGAEADKTGLYALEKADLFNILCIPPITRDGELSVDTIYAPTLKYCSRRRAMLLIDPPASWLSISAAEKQIENILKTLGGETLTRNAAIYFPRMKMADPSREGRITEFVPCGAVAGLFARTDVARGVWKAPAGIDVGLSGVTEFSVKMTDLENGRLNPLGINCLRYMRPYGNVIWGARTLAGTDALGSEWKYVPVRRFALFLEESLYRGTQWVVFEPNDEPLWAQIRLNIGVFLHDLFRQGAFQGRTPNEAYYVKCDKETTTQSDINRGIVNIEVGFAPLKPAEFVIIRFQQITGKLET